MFSTSLHHRICKQLTIIEVHLHVSTLRTLCNLKIHKVHATGREKFCTFHYSRIWVRLLPSLFHVHIFVYVQWFHTSPSHRLCTWVREMVEHFTITQAVYMRQKDGCTSHHHAGCVHASERWFHTPPSHRLCTCFRDGSTPHHHTSCVHGSGRWLHTSPSHRLCTCFRDGSTPHHHTGWEMVEHFTITQAVYMHQRDGSTPHHHTGCVHASEMVPHLTITQAVHMGQ